MTSLAVVNDLLSGLPPRTGIALCLVSEADSDPNVGPLFRQLTIRRLEAGQFPPERLQEWIWAGVVHIGLGKVGQWDRLLVWMEPGGLGDTCLGYHRHHLLAPVTVPAQFPGVNLSQAAQIATGKHPISHRRILPGKTCQDCQFLNTESCRKSHPNPEWAGCTRHKKEAS